MPFQTTQNGGGLSQAANALTKIFVGDPAADAAYRQEQLKGETEYQRQQLLQQQVLSESVQRQVLQANSAASSASAYASANSANAAAAKYAAETERQKAINDSYGNLAKIVTGLPETAKGMIDTDPVVAGVRNAVINQPGFRPSPEFAAPIDQAMEQQEPLQMGRAVDAQMPQILANMMTQGKDFNKDMLGALSAIPGRSDEQAARLMVASGTPLGKDTYVSTGDRDANRRFEVSAGARLADGQGAELLPLAPSFVGLQNAQAGYYNNRSVGGGTGGKVPKFGNDEINASLSMLGKSLGYQPVQLGNSMSYGKPLTDAVASNPQVYMDLMNIAGDVYKQTGGNAATVNQALMTYMRGIKGADGQPLSDFSELPAGVVLPTVDEIMTSIGIPTATPNGANSLANTMTGGMPTPPPAANLPLPNLQNVGNDLPTATNPQTGEKMIFRNGTWESM